MVKHLDDLNPNNLNSLELGVYDTSLYIKDDDVLYNVGISFNYKRYHLMKKVSFRGLDLPPYYNQVVTITRTGESPIYERTKHKLTFTRYTDNSNMHYVMPSDLINITVDESYADFFRDSPTGGNPVNDTEPHTYWWFMIYDKNDVDKLYQRFCFLPYWATERWPDMASLTQEYIDKLNNIGATPDIKPYTLELSDINLKITVHPDIMSPYEINMRVPSHVKIEAIDINEPYTNVITSLSSTSKIKGTTNDHAGYSNNIELRNFYSTIRGQQKIPIKVNNDGDYDDAGESVGANYYHFGETDSYFIFNEELKKTYLIQIYSVPRGLEIYGYHEYMFIIEKFNDVILPEEVYDIC